MKKIGGIAVKLYIVLLFTLLPLYHSNQYFNILHDKTNVYLLLSLGLIALLSLLAAVWLAVGLVRERGTVAKVLKEEYRSACSLDEMVLAFSLLALLATKLSQFPASSYHGEVAWDVGSRVILISTVIYFLISRLLPKKTELWFWVYIGSFAVVLLGVLDRLGYDVLGMHSRIEQRYDLFISTIGNVNFWAGYLAMLVPFFAVAPLFLKQKYARAAAFQFVYLAYFACYLTYSDTCFIGVGTGMLYGIYYCLGEKSRLRTLAINMLLFAGAGLTADVLRTTGAAPRRILTDRIASILLEYKLYAVIGIAGAALLFFAARCSDGSEKICRLISRIWLGIVVAGAAFVIVYVAVNFSPWLFNYRGTIWSLSWKGYLDGSLKDKLIGAGPGLLDSVTQVQLAKVNYEVEWNWYYNTAHNDLLEYLVTTGLGGLILKILIYALPFAMMKKEEEHSAVKAALLAALTGYIGQGLTTGPYILTYVLYMVFLAVFVRYCRE